VRTTLDIDDDVLQAAKELAPGDRKAAGQILSQLARSRQIITNETIHPLRDNI
jgi:hypothetical protein